MSWSRSSRSVARLFRGVAPLVVLGSIALATPLASAQSERSSDEPTPIASNRSGDTITGGLATSSGVVKAAPKVDGTASPGLRVRLDGSGSSGGRMWYRWLQAQGPRVAIEGSTSPEAHFTVPVDAPLLGFVLVVGNASGVDAKALSIDVEDPERDAVDRSLKADAGDDQATKVGRKVVLNGVRSEPRGKIRYRWVQAGGPKVALKSVDGPTATFVPASPGTYQFALVVASGGGMMSEASPVTVIVGGTARGPVDGASMAIDELARASLSSIEGGARHADDLSKAFDAVADGIGSFRSFSEAIAEMTRRLDAIVPRDKERRSVWIERLFSPLMAKIVAGMKGDGLDLAQPGAQAKPLTRDQKARLAEQFRYAAAGLRASQAIR